MSQTTPTLHMLCGKMAAGKSTLAAELAGRPGTVLVSEDTWLDALFAEEISTVADYVRCSSKLKQVMGPHVSALLNAGVSVVLDFPANTVPFRKWMRGILDTSNASHQLHVLDTPDEVCLQRLMDRNASGEHPFTATEAQFRAISKHYAPPSPDEGFNIIAHSGRV
ncbi:MAG: ATP-binding protein [Pseudomonadota bacterium]